MISCPVFLSYPPSYFSLAPHISILQLCFSLYPFLVATRLQCCGTGMWSPPEAVLKNTAPPCPAVNSFMVGSVSSWLPKLFVMLINWLEREQDQTPACMTPATVIPASGDADWHSGLSKHMEVTGGESPVISREQPLTPGQLDGT